MSAHLEFIKKHQNQLLEYLNFSVGAVEPEECPADFVDRVLEEWRERFAGVELPKPTMAERAFWFTLYLFEEILEIPPPWNDPYVKQLVLKLRDMRDLILDGGGLPDGWATRPGELSSDVDIEMEDLCELDPMTDVPNGPVH